MQLVAPMAPWYSPAAHVSHVYALSVAEYEPALQLVQPLARAGE